jgi:Zn-dependent protease
MDDSLIRNITIYALPLIFAITLHEAAHGYVARFCGDNTAYMFGRVSLNPLKHIDPVGTILIPILLYFFSSGMFAIGYAKPVPVSFGNLRHPRRDTIWVALAGPVCNLLQALIWAVLLKLLIPLQVDDSFAQLQEFVLLMAHAGIAVNLLICVFNLFPIPPLDGGRVLVSILPLRAAIGFARIERYGFLIVMALVFTHILTTYWLRPLVTAGLGLLNMLFSFTPF